MVGSTLCWKCGVEIKLPDGKVSFRAICDSCSSWLHCCRGCRNYQPGLPNDCRIPDTDPIADREAANFCEEFVLLGQGPTKSASAIDVAKKLFGEQTEEEDSDDNRDPKSRFNNLFKD
ncbi:Uncharacterized protein SCG7086_CG_00070 [Chlamydiales bacterium SCGC AG-110-P3]|nr:Uncharacterized protein SCG7086_CG_00070 [Chlamydiales bacterium SCGC AG-110-P3]